jgi:hypothetical protein
VRSDERTSEGLGKDVSTIIEGRYLANGDDPVGVSLTNVVVLDFNMLGPAVMDRLQTRSMPWLSS